jgi:hypothetical protein
LLILEELHADPQYLINEKGNFHYSAEKTNTFTKDSSQAQLLISILQTEIVEVINYRCPAVYRDAVVFYDTAGQIISVLDICLSCAHMHNRESGRLVADHETYTRLENFFRMAGHEIDYYDNLFKAILERRDKDKQH